ncbi:hypothetical protein [Leifsonia sp. RAF41]
MKRWVRIVPLQAIYFAAGLAEMGMVLVGLNVFTRRRPVTP